MSSGATTRLDFFVICSIFGALPQIAAAQHITVDGRPAQTLVGPNYAIPATLGSKMGGNLFHSFGKFSLQSSPVQESATFTSDGSTGKIRNVIGRVTGGTMSSIDGAINSNIPGANLYLINPSGIVFGQHATIDVKGSFHASTADYIKMKDGARFQATNPDGSTLSAAAPAAFGFLNATPGRIMVNGSALGVLSGKTLDLVGGPPTSITGATLSAPAGTIRVTSVAGAGEVPAVKGTRNKPTVTSFGSVDITQGSSLDVSSGGSVFIRSGTLAIDGGQINADNNFGSGPRGRLVLHADGNITLSNSARVHANVNGSGKGAAISVKAGSLSIDSAQISSTTFSPGNGGDGGDISVNVAGALSIVGPNPFGPSGIQTQTRGTGTPGDVIVRAGSVSLTNRVVSSRTNTAQISSLTSGSANSGSVHVNAGTLDLQNSSQISSSTSGPGSARDVTVNATNASIGNVSEINAITSGPGDAGTVQVSVTGNLSILGPSTNTFSSENVYTGIGTVTQESTGNAGKVFVSAGSLSIAGFLGEISSSTLGSGAAGDVSVNVAGPLWIAGPSGNFPTGILAAAFLTSAGPATGRAGNVAVTARSLSIVDGGEISSSTVGPGAAGNVSANIVGPLSIAGPRGRSPTGILAVAFPESAGNAGSVVVTAGNLSIVDGGEISSTTAGLGNGGSVAVMTPGALLLDGMGIGGTRTRIGASADRGSRGDAGEVTVAAGNLTILGGAQIASSTAGPGKGGDIGVIVGNDVSLSGMGPAGASGITTSAEPGSSGGAGQVVLMAGGAIALSGGAEVASSTDGAGKSGTVQVTAHGPLSLRDPLSGIVALATQTASGDAGSVMVQAPQITIAGGAQIASTTAGTGMGGSVDLTTLGALVLDGMGIGGTQIAASAIGTNSGPGGPVTVNAASLTIQGGAQIASSTAGPGAGGDVGVAIAGAVSLSGTAVDGTPSRITAEALPGSRGQAGQVTLAAGGMLTLAGGAQVTSSTAGTGNGGSVQVSAQGPLTLTDPGSAIEALASSTASGNAGSVAVSAPQITVTSGAEIASTTAGTGAGGSVDVTTPGALGLNGEGNATTGIAASASGPDSGSGGTVTVSAKTLTVEGGAQIASSTAGPGAGGDVTVMVASDVVLPDPGPRITALSTGSGGAGSITLSAARLLMNNGASISTEAVGERSTASGGNITLHLRDLLYLTSSEISTSVKGQTGNGGNITIDPLLVILNHSSIIGQAIEGHGGDITITADQFIASTDSIVSATSEKGISGTVVINGPRVDVNGALVVLSSELRGRAEVLREACAARGGRPISSFVEAGRGGMPQDPEATLPALYIAGREVNPNAPAAAGTAQASGAQQTTVHLTMRCG